MVELVDLYFAHVNLIMPTLHRPTFERGIADGIHRRSTGFGGVVLLVCAIGSRYCNDPRVFLPDANSLHSAGWKWFDQVQIVRKSLLAPPCLYDLQVYGVGFLLRSHVTRGLNHYCIPVISFVSSRFICSTGLLDYGRYRRSSCAGRWCPQAQNVYSCINCRRRAVETCILVKNFLKSVEVNSSESLLQVSSDYG